MVKKPHNTAGPTSRPAATREATYFLSLSLENVRCFSGQQILDLSDRKGKPARWTIILGNNGTGKTTLLQSLVGFELITLPATVPSPIPRIPRAWVWAGHDPHGLRRSGGEGFSRWTVQLGRGPALNSSSGDFESVGFVIEVHEQGSSFNGAAEHLPLWCCAYGAGRRLGSSSLTQDDTDDATASLFSDKADLRNAEEWLLRLDYSASKPSPIQQQQSQRLSQMTQLLVNVLPEVEEIRFTSPGTSNPTPRVEFRTPYGWVPLRRLGYGYQTLIAWITDLASRLVERYPDSPDPLAEPAVVLVDEIDLHLHPQWQRKLMSFLSERFPSTQFIATAHSPLVVQAAAGANLAVLKREGDHVVIVNDVDVIRGWRVDQILTSDLFGLPSARPPQFDDLLARRKALLTKSHLTAAEQRELEGIEEQIGSLPAGETAEQAKELDLIRSSLELLKQHGPARP